MADPDHLLVLDLDETLIYAAFRPTGRPADFRIDQYYVYRRPHLQTLLESAMQHFRVAVWTSATADYAAAVIERTPLSELDLVSSWSRSRCTPRRDLETGSQFYIKDLAKVKDFPLGKVLMVDDDPLALSRQYGNLVRVRPYRGEENDVELLQLSRYLPTLGREEDVRRIEKRGWQTRVGSDI